MSGSAGEPDEKHEAAGTCRATEVVLTHIDCCQLQAYVPNDSLQPNRCYSLCLSLWGSSVSCSTQRCSAPMQALPPDSCSCCAAGTHVSHMQPQYISI